MNTYNKSALIDLWRQAIIKGLMSPAQRMLDGQPAKRQSGDGTTTLIKIIPLVIVALSLASVTNMASRAYSHHASYSSYAIGLGLAIMVPVIVFTALRLESGWAKMFAWVCAIAFAFASGAIQFQIYNMGQPITIDSLFSFSVNLEALAFGFGVPFAECVLAGLEGLLVWQVEAKEQAETFQKKAVEAERAQADEARAKAEREEAERKERERVEWQAEQERKALEWRAEQERVAVEHAQKLELQRKKEEARLNKSTSNAVQHNVQKQLPSPIVQKNGHKMDGSKGTMEDMLDIYRGEPDASQRDIARRLGRSPQTINNWLKELEAKSQIEVNGIVKVF